MQAWWRLLTNQRSLHFVLSCDLCTALGSHFCLLCFQPVLFRDLWSTRNAEPTPRIPCGPRACKRQLISTTLQDIAKLYKCYQPAASKSKDVSSKTWNNMFRSETSTNSNYIYSKFYCAHVYLLSFCLGDIFVLVLTRSSLCNSPRIHHCDKSFVPNQLCGNIWGGRLLHKMPVDSHGARQASKPNLDFKIMQRTGRVHSEKLPPLNENILFRVV